MKTKKDFGIYPLGSAKLALENGKLNVDCLDNSGVDGVLIKTYGSEDYTINFGAFPQIAKENGVIRTATICRNEKGIAYTAFESYKYYDPEKKKIVLGYNASLLPRKTDIIGKLDGKEVFRFDMSDFIPTPNNSTKSAVPILLIVPIIIGVADIAVEIWSELRTKKNREVKVKYDKDGNPIGYEITYSEDPIEFDVEVKGQTFKVTEICLSYSLDNIDSEEKNVPISVAEEITAYNIKNFVIESIEINK